MVSAFRRGAVLLPVVIDAVVDAVRFLNIPADTAQTISEISLGEIRPQLPIRRNAKDGRAFKSILNRQWRLRNRASMQILEAYDRQPNRNKSQLGRVLRCHPLRRAS